MFHYQFPFAFFFFFGDTSLYFSLHCTIQKPLCCLCLKLRCPLSAAPQRGLLRGVTLSLMNIWTSLSLPRHQKQVGGEEAKSPPVFWKTSNCFIKCQRTHNICLISSAGLAWALRFPAFGGALLCVAQAAAQTDSGGPVLAALVCALTALTEQTVFL